MDNLLNFSADDLEPYMFGSNQEEERKVHTPFVEPQDFSFDGDSSIKPICTKIQFTFDDYAVAKKAKSRKTKTVEDPNSNKKCGHWSSDENKRYHWFLEVHHQHFFNKHLRRTDRIFKSMANFVQTREAQQCRSHHQKMQKKYKYFSKILMSLRLQNYNSNDTDIILSDMSSKGHDISELSFLPAQQLRVISESTNQQQKQMFQIKTTPKARISKFQNSATTLASSCTHLQQACEEQNKQRQVEIFGAFLQRPDDIDDIFNDTLFLLNSVSLFIFKRKAGQRVLSSGNSSLMIIYQIDIISNTLEFLILSYKIKFQQFTYNFQAINYETRVPKGKKTRLKEKHYFLSVNT